MTSPVSPLATLREAIEFFGIRFADQEPHDPIAWHGGMERNIALCPVCRYFAALAVLDSLDGTITLSREEAERLRQFVAAGGCEVIQMSDGLLAGQLAEVPMDKKPLLALLAARIEESK